MSYTIEPVEVHAGAGMKRPFYVKINGEIHCSSSGNILRYKDSMTAALGGSREVDRRKRLAVTMASRLPESSDASVPQNKVGGES